MKNYYIFQNKKFQVQMKGKMFEWDYQKIVDISEIDNRNIFSVITSTENENLYELGTKH